MADKEEKAGCLTLLVALAILGFWAFGGIVGYLWFG